MKRANKRIYMDYAASTPLDPEVIKAVLDSFKVHYGNSSSMHYFGREAKKVLEDSRQITAKALNAKPYEIYFTGSATESNNLAIKGIALANKKGHIIVSAFEHDCVLNSAKWLEKAGLGKFEVTRLGVDKEGLINLKELEKAIRKDTILVSIMHGNNEIGTIQPIDKIGAICRKHNIPFHTDAAQTFGKLPIDVEKMNIDLLTGSSQKMYGPKGVALLYIRKGINISPILHGGGQEDGLRSSTVNIPGIVGFAKAIEICEKKMKKESEKLQKMRDYFINGIMRSIPDSYLNGHPTNRLPNNVNIRFAYVEGEAILMELDGYGIAVSTGSACASGSLEPSHVLLACGLRHEEAHGSIRFSIGRWTTKSEIDYVIKVLPEVIEKIRKISPFKR